MKPLDSTDAEIDAFDTVCRRLGGFSGRIETEWADAYLTAVAAGPRHVDIDEWLPRLCGDAFERAFADPEDEAQARSALQARMRVIAQQLDPEFLLDAPDQLRLQPLVSVWDEETRRQLVAEGAASEEDAATLLTGALWAEGFLAALDDFADDWQLRGVDDEDAEVFKELLGQIEALFWEDGSDEMKAHLERFTPNEMPTREDLIDEACFAIQDLRVWWLDHAPKAPMRRVEAAPGRNDPCPCGSGRKYKRCHGAA